MELTNIIAIFLLTIGILAMAVYIFLGGGGRDLFKGIALICFLLALIFYVVPHITFLIVEQMNETERQATADSYNIQAYYEVESMRRIEEEDWFLFFHIGENEYIEAVIIKDGKKETARFTTDTTAGRIRIDQHENNAVGVDVKDKYHLYITQEDYDRILGYQ